MRENVFVGKKIKSSSPERFELSRGNPMYLAGTRLNHSAKATFYGCSRKFALKYPFSYASLIQCLVSDGDSADGWKPDDNRRILTAGDAGASNLSLTHRSLLNTLSKFSLKLYILPCLLLVTVQISKMVTKWSKAQSPTARK
ncbi:hypothetical protein HHK36_014408 [Tetracentron sinense]|uniref:Uncharacterized protein n=1 Tax=Tetracentron sinense TaxID=13715 RepID=A0A834Z618_TETSI|nr:hypothetical protein HHK36_014408 [Tetracentron sinense]